MTLRAPRPQNRSSTDCQPLTGDPIPTRDLAPAPTLDSPKHFRETRCAPAPIVLVLAPIAPAPIVLVLDRKSFNSHEPHFACEYEYEYA